jgi:hypothetical protein
MAMRKILSGIALLTLAACSTPQPGSPAYMAMAAQTQQDNKVQLVKASSAEVPDWYGEPHAEDRYLTASGTALSTDMQFSIDKAILAAKRTIADQINSRISAKTKDYVSENGEVQQGSMSERTTINTVTEVSLTGYNVVQKKIVPTGTQYRSYVLLQYPLDGITRPPANAARADTAPAEQSTAAKAFEDLSHAGAPAPVAKPEAAAVPPAVLLVPSPVTASPAVAPPVAAPPIGASDGPAQDQPPPPVAAPRDPVESDVM